LTSFVPFLKEGSGRGNQVAERKGVYNLLHLLIMVGDPTVENISPEQIACVENHCGANWHPILFLLSEPSPDYIDKIRTLHTNHRNKIYFAVLPNPVTPQVIEKLILVMHLFLTKRVYEPTKVIDFEHFGPPKVSNLIIVKGQGLAAADRNGLSDPYCKYGVRSFRGKVGDYCFGPLRTAVKEKTLDPVWGKGESAPFNLRYYFSWHDLQFIIEVWDKDLFIDDRIGYCSVPIHTLFEMGPGEHILDVKPVKKEKAAGTITILLS